MESTTGKIPQVAPFGGPGKTPNMASLLGGPNMGVMPKVHLLVAFC